MDVVLIVEDDIRISDQIEKSIASIDREIKILQANEGKKALEIATMVDIDVFILDIVLPDYNGITLAKQLRQTYAFQPIIIESSQCEPAYQIEIHDQIENLAFLAKPFSSKKLIDKVKHALDIAESLRTSQLKIRQNGFSRVIEIDEIIYIEKVKGKKKVKMVLYNHGTTTTTREEFVNVSLNSIIDMLKKERDLLRCHKAYIINPKMIRKLNYVNNTISLKYTNDEIPIGKTYKSQVDLIL